MTTVQDLPRIVSSKATVRFQDCDPFNHLNNAAYIDYFMNHREDVLLEHYKLDIYGMARKEGKSWVSNSSQIHYFRPALLMETLLIESQLIRHSDSELFVEMRMYDITRNVLKAVIWCGFTHYNLVKKRREIHSEPLMTLFGHITEPVMALTFEERIEQFKSNNPSIYI
ncbi:acyl-CoA thioesterase [Sungkyunkwania multivorans]|uniref:Acyl-CoA thioesterase n=1 Tax=Sungkyunkwania multivorans TaxID=1173618 RepID=A0ABW3CVT7_9FLAO